ncbi:5-hydroxytryptamine receptor 4-like [Acanthaster planci]|uniref:5-hydroxytryptamine receptor 4-like n=1 Tax=Acanthaster planci TaxID=133434 RepID=A0A8B7ZDB0_ACAPL|nr:5-hydroxytryptamine receptor 4-like [Acanthaster planci]
MDFQTSTDGEMTSQSPYDVSVVSVIKACLLGVTAASILLGNTTCLIVLRYTHDGVSPVTKLFLISLTTSDLLVGVLVCIPIVGSTALQSWPYGDTYCTVVAMCHALYFNAGLSVLAINIERYIAVIWPLRYPFIVTMARAAIVEIFIVAILLLWTLLYVLLPGRKSFYYSNFNQCFIDFVVGTDFLGHLGMTVFIAVPLLVTVILHARLFLLANRHASRVGNITLGVINSDGRDTENVASKPEQVEPPLDTQHKERLRTRKSPDAKAARTFLIMAVVLTVSWTPYYTTIAWENLRTDPVPEALAFVSQILLFLNSVWNVIIYYTRNRSFRKTANRLLGCCCRIRSRRRDQDTIT